MIKRCIVLSCEDPSKLQMLINDGIYDNTSMGEKCISVQVVCYGSWNQHMNIILTFDS